MPDLDLIRQLGDLLGRPLDEISEAQFERHAEARAAQDWHSPDLIKKDSYALTAEGSVSGLFLRPVTSELLRDFPFWQLSRVRHLYLHRVNLPRFAWLAELKRLTSLDLSSNQISDISFLAELKGLTSLYLRSAEISDISFLAELKGLTSLDLSGNQISDISFLVELKGPTSLDLSDNEISDISFLAELKGLKSLYLRSNQISDISFLVELKELTSLDLSDNRISDISFLAELKGLTSLDLYFNEISDISFLAELKGLTSLDLSVNEISDISFLAELKELTSLDLRCNQISDFSLLMELKGLTSLDLSDNWISDISFLAELKGLTSLDLSANEISDISFLVELKGLTSLDLRGNQVREVPCWLAAGRLAIEVDQEYAPYCINLYRNPIEEPPLEIVRQGNGAILNYYDQIAAQGRDYLYEAKMLIVGEGEAGKTTLAHKIPEPNCPLPHIDDRTRGISICTHTFPCRQRQAATEDEGRTFQLNIWDFGGQEIYHATHRFFLSKRSLYVLVADNRKDDTDFNYWLNIIERFAGNSPLIIVLNEKGEVQRSLNRADLLSRYPDSIKDIVAVNFKTVEEPDPAKAQHRLKAIRTLIGHIQHWAEHLPHIGEPVPARWVDVRHAIEQDDRNYIYREQFDELCHTQGITQQPDIDTLLGYFHDLGILLHFAENSFLRDRVILNPAWATNAVYCLFDDDGIKAKAGRFSRQDCAALWSDPQYRPMHDVLIELMKNFRLVYEIGTTGNLVAPQLLPQNTPTYPWDEAHNSHMQLRYDAFMPRGIFWQLAVTLYRYIPNHDWVWRNGMVIRRGDTWAEVKEDLNLRRIALRFRGPSIAEFRAVIVDELDRISQSYHQLRYDKMIPCQCSECQDSRQPHFFAFADLKKRQEQRRKLTIECVQSGEDVPLGILLDGFEIQSILARVPDKTGAEPTPPDLPTLGESPSSMQTIKIFLASSAELKADREQFEIFISRQNDCYLDQGIRLKLVIWENFLDALSKTRSQDEYNQAIADCDVFVSLFYTKVGQYTEEVVPV